MRPFISLYLFTVLLPRSSLRLKRSLRMQITVLRSVKVFTCTSELLWKTKCMVKGQGQGLMESLSGGGVGVAGGGGGAS